MTDKLSPLDQLLDVADAWLENERDYVGDIAGRFAQDNPRTFLESDECDDPYVVERYADTLEATAALRPVRGLDLEQLHTVLEFYCDAFAAEIADEPFPAGEWAKQTLDRLNEARAKA